jgi:hypothetical protein
VPSSRERESARLTPALYHLLPSCPGVSTPPGLPADLYNPAVWQPSIVDSIAEFIRLHGLTPGNAATQAPQVLAQLLAVAKAHRNSIDTLNLQSAGLTPNAWLCVVGADSVTRVGLPIKLVNGKPYFDITSADRKNEWGSATTANRFNTGDGTVPFAGAEPGFLARENLVCVTPDDYGYWELQDRALARLAGFHGILPNMDMLHRLIVAHFTGRGVGGTNIWGRPAPGVTQATWKPPIANLLAK